MIVYTKEYIADTKVMRRNVYNDGTVKIEFVRNIEFKDTKKFPNLLPFELDSRVNISNEEIEKIPIYKPNPIEDIKKIVENLEEKPEIKPEEKNKSNNKSNNKSKNKSKEKQEEVILPKPEDLG